MDVAVRTVDLRKTYLARRGRRVAVAGLSMTVPHGGVHGFLGPNGSGKTTTIRMLLGLARADSGTAEVFGHQVPKALPRVIDRVGAIVESPKFFPAFSARQNLTLLAGAIGSPRSRVDEVLEATHLHDRARDRYAGFSLGMKQRLAIAATLLKDPDLLIFDEPTNGLDPAGIREVRDTMKSLGAQGKTVLVSSHILAEVEQVADTVSIIGSGTLLAEGLVGDILGGQGVGQVRVGVASPDRAAQVLDDEGLTVVRDGAYLLVSTDDPAAVTRALAGHGLFVSELVPIRPDLESAFLALTADQGLGSDVDRAAGGGAGAGAGPGAGGSSRGSARGSAGGAATGGAA
jgi:ABC-2 type transport system ATP-binding protein